MHIVKVIIGIILTAFITGFLSGLLMYSLRPLFFDPILSPGGPFWHVCSIGLVYAGLVFVVYLLIMPYLSDWQLYQRGLLCVVIVILFLLLLGSITFGINCNAIAYILSSVGIVSCLMPFVYHFLSPAPRKAY